MSIQMPSFPIAKSPCINLCKLDARGSYCLGCFRSLDEIGCWSEASNEQRLAILAAADRRRGEAER